MDRRNARLTLAAAARPTPRVLAHLLQHAGSPEALLAAPARDFPAGMRADRVRAMRAAWHGVRLRPLQRRMDDAATHFLTPEEDGWPCEAFQALPDPPVGLFVRGGAPPDDPRALGIVGTRSATPYGLRLARQWAADLAHAGVPIISGLALGIDGAAHEGALDAGASGRTWAVLGGGTDPVYPVEHTGLASRIESQGGLLSEWCPGTSPRPWHFLQRNRLVAALSRVVVVVEAPLRSGALNTARLAVDFGRDVLAVPGAAHWRTSAGCHRLVQRGEAALACGIEDVRFALQIDAPDALRAGALFDATPQLAGPVARSLWLALDEVRAVSEDELIAQTGLALDEVLAQLDAWEAEGWVARQPGIGLRRRMARHPR